MLRLTDQTEVYICLPTASGSGGPELLFQLSHELIGVGATAYMVYTGPPHDHSSRRTLKHPAFERYSSVFVPSAEVHDNEHNILVVPELYQAVEWAGRFRSIQKVAWWLSVDNFYVSAFRGGSRHYRGHLPPSANLKWLTLRAIEKASAGLDVASLIIDQSKAARASLGPAFAAKTVNRAGVSFCLCQSQYAMDHLTRLPIRAEVHYLSDYLNDAFLSYDYERDRDNKKDTIVYNPKKGARFTLQVLAALERAMPNIEVVPLAGLTRQGMVALLKQAKVYIDFGEHPGKDRIPREAAMCGCCVITGKRGSACYQEDVPIPPEYKFDGVPENLSAITQKITDCLRGYDRRRAHFDGYRNAIRQERARFTIDVHRIFGLQPVEPNVGDELHPAQTT